MPRRCDIVAAVYGSVVKAGIYRAPSIKVAEAAKVIENTQRDLNIAFMNELSTICSTSSTSTPGTCWRRRRPSGISFRSRPGLVGGHCIGVDPYYLTHRAEQAGFHPEVILAGRRVNDSMGRHVARECLRLLAGKSAPPHSVTVLGLTFKENVPDIRNSKVVDIVRELESLGAKVQVHDPLAFAQEAMHEYAIGLIDEAALPKADAVILAVAHEFVRRRRMAVAHAPAQGRPRRGRRRPLQARSRDETPGNRFVAALERFPAKWEPVRRRKRDHV